jgi:hypothetical protein
VGEPLNAEAVIWGEENFGFLFWTIGGKRNGRYDELSFDETRFHGRKPLPGVEIAIAEVNGSC